MIQRKHIFTPRLRAGACLAAMALNLAGCAVPTIHQEQRDIGKAGGSAADTPAPVGPVFQVHEGSWLLGEKIQASKPQPEIYNRIVDFNSGSSSPTLTEIVSYLSDVVRVRAEIDASANGMSAAAKGGVPAAPMAINLGQRPAARVPELPAGLATSFGGGGGVVDGSFSTGPIRYRGRLRGFLDVVDARFGVWSHYVDGTVSFYRTETRTFTIGSLPEQSSMSGSISTSDSSSGSGSGSSGSSGSLSPAASPGGIGGSSGSSGGSSGQQMSLAVGVSPWASLKDTAQSVAGQGAQVTVDPNLGTLTVTGSPPQCDRVEALTNNLDAMFGKQVAIDVHVYEIRTTGEENYGVNLALALKTKSGHTSAGSSTVSIPTVSSAATPMTFGATILQGPFAGTGATIQALSTMGDVSEVVSRSGITQNGKVLALQAAQSVGYVSSSTSTLTASVGNSTAIATSTLVPGFTSSFLPKVVNGRILMAFDMTLSDLLSLQTFTSGTGTGQSSVELPTMQLARFEQSVTLKPGETLVLTGMRQQSASSTNNGVGVPQNFLLGGGLDASHQQTVLAVVITARIL
jgi:type IVB pilus formation R64 PilN family outer membrane protein